MDNLAREYDLTAIRKKAVVTETMNSAPKGDIYAKIDWYSAIFVDRTVAEVIHWCGLDYDCYCDEFFQNQIDRASGLDDKIIFSYNNVNIEVKQSSYYGRDRGDLSVFDIVVPKIRLDISGRGLDFLRSQGVEVDTLFRDPDKLLDGQHLTRCDFAFDFVNIKGDFLDQCIDYCQKNHTANNRLVCMNLTAGLVYDIHTGSQKTLYIGSPQSDRLLRIYDKNMQAIDPNTGAYKPDMNPYGSPATWIRVELQTRNKLAHGLCTGDGDFQSILKYIYEKYCFADLSTPAHRREPAKFWSELWDWENIPQIVQNLHNPSKVSPIEQAKQGIATCLQSFALAVSTLGWSEVFYIINDYLWCCQNPEKSPNIAKFLRCNRKLSKRYNEMGLFDLPHRDGLVIGEDKKMRFVLSSQSMYEMENILRTIDERGSDFHY